MQLQIFNIRAYSLYFTGTTVSQIGTGMQLIANNWLILKMTNTSYSVALILIFSSLPGIILSPVFGVLIDRIERKLLAVIMDIFRAIVLLFVPLLWWFDMLLSWHLYLMAFLIAIGDEIYEPATKALIVEVIPKEMLLIANSATAIAIQIAWSVGAGIAGVVITLFSPITVMLINSGTFLCAAFCIFGIRKKHMFSIGVPSTTKGWKTFFVEMKQGVEYFQQHLDIMFNCIMLVFLFSTIRIINVLTAPFAKNVLNVGVQGFSYIQVAFAFGAIAGGFLIPQVSRLYGTRRTMTTIVWVLSASIILFATAHTLWMAILGYFLIGITIQVRILYLTEAQNSTDTNYQGRVFSFFNAFMALVSLVIYTLIGVLGEIVPLQWLYIFQGLLIATFVLLAQKIVFFVKKILRV